MPARVCVIHGVADLAAEVERAREIEYTLPHDQMLERFSLHVFHHDEEHIVLFLCGEDGDDVRMAHGGEQPRLLEHLAEIEILLVGNFEGDLLVDPGVFGQVDDAKAATAK